VATISATSVSVRHAIARALSTTNLSPSEATFRVLSSRVEIQGRSRIVNAEATLAIFEAQPIGAWDPARLVGTVNPDGHHPLMVRIPSERPFYLDVLPVTWERWLRRVEDTLPPTMDPACPRTGITHEQAEQFAASYGKRLPTEAELRFAWGTDAYPWGPVPDPGLGRAGPPRYDDLPEVGGHPPNRLGLQDLGAWLWHWTAEGTLSCGRADGPPGFGVPWTPELRPVGFRLAADG